MIDMKNNSKYYRCFSGKLKKYLSENKIKYILRAKDFYTNKTFWLYEINQNLSNNLKEWTDTNPY